MGTVKTSWVTRTFTAAVALFCAVLVWSPVTSEVADPITHARTDTFNQSHSSDLTFTPRTATSAAGPLLAAPTAVRDLQITAPIAAGAITNGSAPLTSPLRYGGTGTLSVPPSPVPAVGALTTFAPSAVTPTAPLIETPDNPIIAENRQQGTTTWKEFQGTFRDADDTSMQVKGYASTTSAARGENITFFVTVNPVQTVGIDLYRIGWYDGLGARLLQHIGPLNGIKQPPCPVDAATNMVSCQWAATYTFNIPTTWTSGVYLAQLTNEQGFQNYVPFVVRDGRSAALLYQQSVATYQAYNMFSTDGVPRGLYSDPPAVKASFDRPYQTNGAGHFLDFEVAFVQWLERLNYDVTYSTDIDTHAHGTTLLNSKAFLSVGHDEYWSREMYDAVEQARDAGVSLGFFGGNPAYFQVRFEPSSSGSPNRVIVCYRSADADPVHGATTTVRWRDAPVNRPEQRLVGIQYTASTDYSAPDAPYVVTAPSHWVFQGTGVTNGTAIPNVVGYEIDRYQPEFPLPAFTVRQVLSASPFISTTNTRGADTSNSAIYRSPSRAWVFAAGTIRWGKALDPVTGDARIQQITRNVLNAFILNPSTDNPVITSSGRIETGSVPVAGGFGLVVFGGGTDAELVSASGCPAATAAFWASDSGTFTTYVPGSRVAVVNEGWHARFPSSIPRNTPLIGRCRN